MADTTSSPAVRSARPTILLSGQESASLGQGLLAMRVEESVTGMASCELAIGNWGPIGDGVGFLYYDRGDIDFGKDLAVRVAGDTLFSGRISGMEGQFPDGSPPSLLLMAEDRLQDLRMTRRTRTFENLSDAALIQQIAKDHGLDPDVRLDGPTHRVLAQLNQSDLAFIRERCRAVDAEAWVEDKALRVRTHKDRRQPSGDPLELGYRHELREFTVVADLAGQASELTVGGWDVAGKAAIKETAAASIIQPELDGGDSGASILGAKFADRKATVAHTTPITGSEGKARAETLYRRRARRFVRGEGLAETSGGLRVGRSVKLTGLGPLFSGTYYVVHTRIVFDPLLGLRTEFTAERPSLGRP
jgi:uncharacterized protein